MKHLLPASLSTLAFLIAGCLSDSDSPSPQGARKVVGPYRVEGNQIIVPERIETRTRCDAGYPDTISRLVAIKDTLAADTTAFELSGRSMILLGDADTLQSGAIVVSFTTLDRIGSGSGVEGLWQAVSAGYRVLSGTLTDDEKLRQEKSVERQNKRYSSSGPFQALLANGTITTYDASKPAEIFLADWNGEYESEPEYADSAQYAISVRVVDGSTVELTGKTSGEIVHLTFQTAGSRTYSSSNPAHAEYRYENPPRTCPNPSRPAWYGEFLIDNAKTSR